MPSSILNNKSPFEVFYKISPTYDHLRSFGYLCYAATLKRNRDKLQSRANSCIFIGYPFSQKGYKLFDLKSKKVIISKDVVFHETIFPFHSLHHSSDIPLLAIISLKHQIFHLTIATLLMLILTHKQNHLHLLTLTPSVKTLLLITHIMLPHYMVSHCKVLLHHLLGTSEGLPEHTKQPAYLQDFYCDMVQINTLPREFHAFHAQPSQYFEPKNYEEAAMKPE